LEYSTVSQLGSLEANCFKGVDEASSKVIENTKVWEILVAG